MKIMASYSLKGGVGKTAFSVNLAYWLAKKGYRTLLVDLDPQGAAGFYFRVSQERKFAGAEKEELFESLAENIRESDYSNLDVIPSHATYRKLDIWLNGMKKSKSQLREFFGSLSDIYDVVILDCPPTITLVAENVFRAADLVLVPLIPTPLSVRTYEQVTEFFRKDEIPSEKLVPFFSMVSNRLIHQQIMETLRATEPRLLQNSVPFSSIVERMGIERRPLFDYAPSSKPAKDFDALCSEIATLAFTE